MMPNDENEVFQVPFDRHWDEAIPIYLQIRDFLKMNIMSGQIVGALPGELRLAGYFGVSRGTVKQAVEELVGQNLLYRARGSGTFVNSREVDKYYQEISSFTGAIALQGYEPTITMIGLSRQRASAAVAERLHMAPDRDVFIYRRAVSANAVPVAVTDSYLPADLFDGFQVDDPHQSLYMMLRNRFGVTPVRADEEYSIAVVDDVVAGLLQISPRSSVLSVLRLTQDQNANRIEYAVTWFVHATLNVTTLHAGAQSSIGGNGLVDDSNQWRQSLELKYDL